MSKIFSRNSESEEKAKTKFTDSSSGYTANPSGIDMQSPISWAKAIKNDAELQGMKNSHLGTPADILPIPLVWLLTSLLLELASRHIVNTHSVSDMLSFPQTTPAGYYEGHAFGIRIENLLHVRDAETPNRFGGATYLLGFEKLTYFSPFRYGVTYQLIKIIRL
ncbi:hypothetical protein ARALYDRAFT_896609 [Arabidopsis lyrata subsp. lyrata]|uniref:Uncharacterized protein n=1 Tax=Arabidopsis lyrata subsp. lyrata TaxID=81972 RepID=D7L3T3_ARALL|nr:hypothetical protein ARALYDRAFT_896609 [Arabidopsis lyrata subsp. lyrata]